MYILNKLSSKQKDTVIRGFVVSWQSFGVWIGCRTQRRYNSERPEGGKKSGEVEGEGVCLCGRNSLQFLTNGTNTNKCLTEWHIIHRTNILKIYMESQKALQSNSNPEKEQSWKNHAT